MISAHLMGHRSKLTANIHSASTWICSVKDRFSNLSTVLQPPWGVKG